MSDNNININTPDIGPYTQLRPFRFWCQKVLPLVYDESLSYYELLCKVIDYLNKTMEDVDQMITDMGDFQTAYTDFTTETRDAYIAFSREVSQAVEGLETFVNNYFNNLNVQTEINNKLDAMAAAGYFDTLFTTLFTDDIITKAGNVTSAWIAENLLQETGYVIDNSLTVANAAADAKATGDALRQITGKTNNIINGDSIYSLRLTGESLMQLGGSGTTVFFPCVAGRNYFATKKDGTAFSREYWAFFSSEPSPLDTTANYITGGTEIIAPITGYGAFCPLSGSYSDDLVANTQIEEIILEGYFIPPFEDTANDKIARNELDIAPLPLAVFVLDEDEKLYENAAVINCTKEFTSDKITFNIPNPITGVANGTLFSTATTPINPITGNAEIGPILHFEFDVDTDVATDEYFEFKLNTAANNTLQVLIPGSGHYHITSRFTDIRYGFISYKDTFTAGKYIALSNVKAYQSKRFITSYDEKIHNLKKQVEAVTPVSFTGDILTIGDSLTNSAGQPDGLRWQDTVIEKFGFNDYQTGGGAGLTVANVGLNSIYSHVQALTYDADVKFITFWGGTNDWSSSVVIGDFDTEKVAGTRDNTTFIGGLFDCIEAILTLYPTTPLIMIGTTQRITDYDNNRNSNNAVNSNGDHLYDFVEAAKKVAEYYSIPFCDLYHDSGINVYSIPTYMYQQTHEGLNDKYYLHLSDAGELHVGKKISAFITANYSS